MLAPPEMALPPLQEGQRVYICSGTPWTEALDAVRNPSDVPNFKGWKIHPSYREGDWILTHLTTDPRVFLCWEQASQDGSPNTGIRVDPDASVVFDNLIVVDRIEARTGLTIKADRFFTGDEATRLRQEIVSSLRLPRLWHEPQ